MAIQEDILLEIRNLKVAFSTFDSGLVQVVDGMGLDIRRGQTIGLVGESGSGKTVTAMAVMRLLAEPQAILSGQIQYHGGAQVVDLLKLKQNSRAMRSLRGNDIAMVFQEPMRALSPVFSVGHQIIEAVTLHRKVSKKRAEAIACEMLGKVGLANPSQLARQYPHELSGGQRQRVMIAMALVCEPKLLIADEPTTALDVTIQAQILDLLKSLQEELGLAIWLITHDLGIVAQTCTRAGVMYMGKLVEQADIADLYARPHHPYTKALLECVPVPGRGHKRKLRAIPGTVPDLADMPQGCPFGPRCDMFTAGTCDAPVGVPIRQITTRHWSRCYRALEM